MISSLKPSCPLCGHSSTLQFSTGGYTVFACQGDCGLLFVHPYPGEERIHNEAAHGHEDMEISDPETYYRASVEYYNLWFPLIAADAGDAGTVLDVGCGTGRLLELLSPKLAGVGIEPNPARAGKARQVSGAAIIESTFEAATELELGSFDRIMLVNVISHVPISSFPWLFGRFHDLLKREGGAVILKTGEITPQAGRWDIFDWEIPDHVHFFGLNTITYLADKYGFDIVRHHRRAYSEDMFSKELWKAPGRSRRRNLIKKMVVRIPFALNVLRYCYNRVRGVGVYSSLMVLAPKEGAARN